MKIIIQSVVAVTAVCLLAGCETTGLSPRESTGYSPSVIIPPTSGEIVSAPPREISGASYQEYIMNLPTGDKDASRNLSTPTRLAVAQVGEATPPESMLDKLAKEKTLVASVNGLPLPGEGYYDSANLDYPDRIKKICNLARTSGADFLFLYGGTLDSWRDNNYLSILDATLVGGAIIPATKIHIEGKAAGALISTTTCQPVLFASADANSVTVSPDYFAAQKTTGLRAKVRDELVAKLTDQLLNKLRQSTNQ